MANTTKRTINEMEESSVRNTSAAEMPDTSKIASIGRRIRAAAPVFSNEVNFKTFLIPLALVGVGVSAYFLVNRYRSSNSESDSET